MKFIAIAISAAVGLAAAQLDQLANIPSCALSCFTNAVASTDCALTDFYCQCGPNAAKLQASALECLCESTCTTTDLAKVYGITNSICKSTLESHGETYAEPASLSAGVCSNPSAAVGAAPAASSSAAAAPMSPSSTNSSGSAMPSGNSTMSGSPSASSGAFEGSANAFGMSLAAVAAGGLAFFAL